MQHFPFSGLFLTVALAVCAPGVCRSAEQDHPAEQTESGRESPLIQVAILLDTSGSMQGLIHQARTQLWKIVNELATTKRDGQTPDLQVALYEYGKSSIPASEGHLRRIVPLTDDLDRLSTELFALRTNGGDEYCGQVIDAATRGLQWSDSDEDLKMIFIAGNEPFTQGSVDFRAACTAAIQVGVTVNTIHCGPEAAGISTGWKEAAQLADGSFMCIDQNRAVAQVTTPFDKRLSELSRSLNATYVQYGDRAEREGARNRQLAADAAASGAAPAAAAERAAFKSTAQYANAMRDLARDVAGGKVKLKDINDKELPEEFRGKSLSEKEALLEGKVSTRVRIEKEIRELSDKRNAFIAKARSKETADKGAAAFDEALLEAVRQQATKKNFTNE